jgi:hypothetical protein
VSSFAVSEKEVGSDLAAVGLRADRSGDGYVLDGDKAWIPTGVMVETRHGGRFTGVTLRPRATVAAAEMVEQATALHERAHGMCFIANSVNFPVSVEPVTTVLPAL